MVGWARTIPTRPSLVTSCARAPREAKPIAMSRNTDLTMLDVRLTLSSGELSTANARFRLGLNRHGIPASTLCFVQRKVGGTHQHRWRDGIVGVGRVGGGDT